MMDELVAAAKEPLGLRSIWIDDEEYEAIINAVITKLGGYSHDDANLLALAASDRLNRLLRICRGIAWTGLGEPAMKENATKAAMHELASFLLQDALDRRLEAGNGAGG